MRRLLPALVLLGALLAAAGCSSTEKTEEPVEAKRGALPGSVTPGFQAMRSELSRAQQDAADDGAGGVRAHRHDIVETGIGLLREPMPHDLDRADVPRFLEARLAFGDALKAFEVAVAAPRDEALLEALRRLVDAFWAWVDAYKGMPPERSV